MAEQGAAGRHAVLRGLVALTALVALAAGGAAVAALLVGRALTDALPVDVGAHRVSTDTESTPSRASTDAATSQVHVAPDHFDFPEWKPQSPGSPSLVTVVPGPGVDRQALEDSLVASFGPVVQFADQVRWVSAVDE